MKDIALNRLLAIIPLMLLLLVSCERDDEDFTEIATAPPIGEVFVDGFSSGLDYGAFDGSKLTAFQVDKDETYSGQSAMRIEVPSATDTEGTYAGGTFYDLKGRDLSGFNVLTFWAKASQSATINELGFGLDFDDTYADKKTVIFGLPVNTNWKRYYIPIPNPAKYTAEKGLFFFAEGPEDDKGYTIWIDELKFDKLSSVTIASAKIFDGAMNTVSANTGDEINITGTFATYNIPASATQTVEINPAVLTYESSDKSVATVNDDGVITVVSSGTATITAKLVGTVAQGSLTVNAAGTLAIPPTPTVSASDVISLYSNSYDNETVGTFKADWSNATLATVQTGGNDVLKYTFTGGNYLGITDFDVDASDMTHLSIDILTTDPDMRVKLVDFGADGAYQGGDDSEHEITFSATSTPAITTGDWMTLQIPLTDFTGLASKADLTQLVLAGDAAHTFYIDNIFFYDDGTTPAPTGPTTAAPTPTYNVADVTAMFSGGSYSDVAVSTWSPSWDGADVADVQVGGNATKLYSNLSYAIIETSIDASSMTHFSMDIWTSDDIAAPKVFKIKLVDFGANGTYQGGDDVEHELSFNTTSTPSITGSTWSTLNIPLTDFVNLTTKANISQIVISGDPNTVYIDNILFHK